MFTGIIETQGQILRIEASGTNKILYVTSPISKELKVDQSLSHNGVCLTVEDIESDIHRVTAILETRNKTALNEWKVGDRVNLERCLQAHARIDGHFVQGHVDCVVNCLSVTENDGSWTFRFDYPKEQAALLVPQGSITVNGISLTISGLAEDYFEVSIIPYTFEQTSMGNLKANQLVNIEFDILGKYIQRNKELQHKSS